MPADAPRTKLEGTRALGAAVVTYDRAIDDREAIGREIAGRTGAVLIRPYDDALIVAGQGTLGLELADQAARLGAELDATLVCCGGGGLVAGCALALTHLIRGIAVHAVEPLGFDDTTRSLAVGRRLGNVPGSRSLCDALLAPMPGELTFAVNSRLLAGGLVVTDDEVTRAMRLAFRHLKLVVEPGGAVALAAALSGRFPARDRTVGIVLSGGNVDADLFARVLAEDPSQPPDP
jgi:threonine dehydratase